MVKPGDMRFCIQLNRDTKLDEFPLRRIDDSLALLSGAKYFITLDLGAGYWQVRMDPRDQESYMSSRRCLLACECAYHLPKSND